MKITALVLLAACIIQSATAAQTKQSTVTVCMDYGKDRDVVEQAQFTARKMFGEIGVNIQWHEALGCPSNAIVITLNEKTPATLLPGALAEALPIEGIHICVFYDRMGPLQPIGLIVPVLAHVLVHEITHILQGIDRHSQTGVMKAHWDTHDFRDMAVTHLPFTAEDVRLIHAGLEHRAVLAATAGPEANSQNTLIVTR